MDNIRVCIPSMAEHNAQVIAGFLMLKEKGMQIEITDESSKESLPFWGMPCIQVEYLGKKVLYDLLDGYQYSELIRKGLEWADVYFKRSFSNEKNELLFPDKAQIMYPLGFNYHVTYKGSPFNEPTWKIWTKYMLGKTPRAYFQPKVFEGVPRVNSASRIIFFTRLWDLNEEGLSEELKNERLFINETRIEIIRSLRKQYGSSFVGGLNDTVLSRQVAGDCIVSGKYTDRKNYLKLLHSSDICIGSMGLHESIGWKTGEYVAAAKAIVNETFHYDVPGDFYPGKNYLPYQTVKECLDAVQTLLGNPEKISKMQIANAQYYQEYLRPDALVSNTLRIIENLGHKNEHTAQNE